LTIAIWCILAAGLLPYLATLVAKSRPGFDNTNPRAWLQKQDGFRQRANNAQLNSFEAFPLFAAAVIIGTYLQVARHSLDELAVGFVVARVLYIVCYIANWAALRSLVWFAGMFCCVAIFVAAART
jgi:uncharacterized MAPEG superfamily protein